MKKCLQFFLMSLVLFGCNSSPKNQVRLNADILDKASVLKADSVSISGIDVSRAKELYVYADSILIARNYERDGNHLIEMYNLNTKKLINKIFGIGHGQGEVLLSDVTISYNTMFVRDYQQQKSCTVNLDSAISDMKYIPKFQKIQNRGISKVAIFKGKEIVENSYAFEDEKSGIHQPGKKLLTAEEYDKEKGKSHKYDVMNVASNGLIIISPNDDRIFYANTNQSFLEMYDSNLNRTMTITGPKDMQTDYQAYREENEVLPKKYIPYAYADFYCSKEDFGLIYYGVSVDANNYDFEKKNAYLFVFDWNGNMKKSINLKCHVKAISKSKHYKDSYYICTYGEGGNLKIYRLHE